jgi:hypothetical protein
MSSSMERMRRCVISPCTSVKIRDTSSHWTSTPTDRLPEAHTEVIQYIVDAYGCLLGGSNKADEPEDQSKTVFHAMCCIQTNEALLEECVGHSVVRDVEGQ